MARKAFERMQAIRPALPEQRVIMHETAAALLQMEGRTPEAAAECVEGLAVLKRDGEANTIDAAPLLNTLGALYIYLHQLDEAVAALDRALSIFTVCADTSPLDRIKLFDVRAGAYARKGDWHRALENIRQAVSLADHEPHLDLRLRAVLLDDYAKTLRKNHQGREARVMETRAAAVRRGSFPPAIVDVTEFAARTGSAR